MDKITAQWSRQRQQPFQAPQGSQRLFELINAKDARYLDVFYFAIKDTLVCNNIDTASQIAYGQQKRYRVVTLRGDLIEITGTMSGGGKPKTGGMSSKMVEEYSDDQINEQKNVVAKAEQMYQSIKDLLPSLEKKKQDL